MTSPKVSIQQFQLPNLIPKIFLKFHTTKIVIENKNFANYCIVLHIRELITPWWQRPLKFVAFLYSQKHIVYKHFPVALHHRTAPWDGWAVLPVAERWVTLIACHNWDRCYSGHTWQNWPALGKNEAARVRLKF